VSELKKVLILSQYYSPEPGAPSIRLGQLTKRLVDKNIRVSVITGMPNYPTGKIQPEYKGVFFKKEKLYGAEITRTAIYPATGKNVISRLLNYFSFMMTSFFPLLFSKRVDLIFVEAQPIILAIPAYIVGKIRNIPYVYNTPDLQVEYAKEDSWISVKILISIALFLEKFLMRNALSVTTVTHGFIKFFHRERNIDLEKFTFLPNGSDLDQLHISDYDKEYADKFNVLGRKVFTFAGTFAPYQGIETIIHAADLLRDEEIIFLLAGKGPVKDSLKQLVKEKKIDNVKFIDSPFNEMNRLMSITYASVIVLRDLEISKIMRLSKTFPPLACGVPVIFSGFGESSDIVKEFDAGLTTNPEDPLELAKAISYIIKNPEKRNQMGLNGRRYIEDNLSWEFIIDDWLRQIKNILNGEKTDIPNFKI